MSLPPESPDASASGAGKWAALTAAFLGWMFDGFEMGLFPLVARPALRELMNQATDKEIAGWFSAIMAGFLVGAALGGLLFGWLGDRVGRVRAMVWSVLTYALFSGLCAFASAPWQLGALRFIASLGMGGEWALGVALVMEVWPGSSRPALAALIGAAANVGFLLIAVIGLYLTSVAGTLAESLRAASVPPSWAEYLVGADQSSWRLLMLIGAFPAALTFLIRMFVPESERWRRAAAAAPEARIADVFRGGLARITILATGLGAVALMGTWASIQYAPAWADRLSDMAPGARSWTQIYSASGAIVGTALAAFIAEWTSRRLAYFSCSLLSLLVCAYLFRVPHAYGDGFLLLVGLAGCITASFYGWLPLYLPEIFPTRVRATGQGFAFNFGRIVAAGGTLGSGALLEAFDGDYARMCSVISLVYVAGLIIIWFCPETKGKPLPP
jgi:MFS family permease